jgi:nucleotide-binding universal stress UspA family protein
MNTDARIVVGYDGTPDSVAALAWAAQTASLRGEAVVAVTVINPREIPRGMAWPESYWAEIDDQAEQVFAQWPDVPASRERHDGPIVARLLEAAEGASMVVVGSHGHTTIGEMLLGSVSQKTARNAGLPVVVVRPPYNDASGRIVVGADGSESSIRATEFACRMAELTGDKVIVLRAWDPHEVPAGRFATAPPPSGITVQAAEGALGRIVDELRVQHPQVPVEGEIFHGPADRGLRDAADNAAMVVVGSRGHHAVGEVFAGSVSRALLHHAHCPVAVIH